MISITGSAETPPFAMQIVDSKFKDTGQVVISIWDEY